MVFKADTVVCEGTVMVILEDTGVTHGAVVSSGRFQVITLRALLGPEPFEICHSFSAVLHQPLHIFLQPLKPVVFNFLLILRAISMDTNFGCFSSFTVFDFFSYLFIILQVFGTSWLDYRCPKVVENDIVEQ